MNQEINGNDQNQNCCGEAASPSQCRTDQPRGFIIPLEIAGGSKPVPEVSTQLTWQDNLGTLKARLGISRMNYKVEPGLYRVGQADDKSPVFVTANYKMSFDMLRKELSGLDAWIMVLDTKGINVWCAAGKGTFGTNELVNRIALVDLARIVSHRKLILPQLGAPGVSAHEVTKRSGFKVVFGPVRASDIKDFLKAGMKATPEMRQVRFTMYDRLVLTPIELAASWKFTLMVLGVLFILNLIKAGSFGIVDFYGYIGAWLTGCVIVPLLLPWIPGKAFAWKGWLIGMLWAVGLNYFNGWPLHPQYGLLRAVAYMLILPSVSAFFAMNFTGSSTYTSLSGVLKEMKTAVPAIAASVVLGISFILAAVFMPGI